MLKRVCELMVVACLVEGAAWGGGQPDGGRLEAESQEEQADRRDESGEPWW
jgi:hypothetical protein